MEINRPQTSRRDRDELRQRLQRWLAERLEQPTVGELSSPSSTGMSSETLLFEVTSGSATQRRTDRCVARLPPDADDMPVFPTYDMSMQHDVLRLVGERTAAPVPETLWSEPDASWLGAPFFVMRRVDGVAPPDLLPYTMGGNWFFEASPADQDRATDSAIAALAEIHRIDADDPGLPTVLRAEHSLHAHVDAQRAYYEWVVGDGPRARLAEEMFDYLAASWPRTGQPRQDVLSWGDARIGNILFDDFQAAAVLDWEMAAVGPREVDLGWMIYMHRFFQDLAEQYGLPGLPGVLRRDAAAQRYAQLTGYDPVDLDWYICYAALRHYLIMFRIHHRSVRFGEAAPTDDPDSVIVHAPTIRAMLDGTYLDRLAD